MEQIGNGLVIIGMLFIVVFIGAVRKKAEWIINFVLRMVLGTIIIYFANSVLNHYGINISVAVNPISILVSGFLGIPGIAVLYGINYFIV
ncbi:MAG: pro-sigmaK processing inhibitor BofA family protein [Lachnospiraceae bacterium]|nr:pro-sigmaK processing inhibitor BofA family protein [Lachnospiraceae bacterium]